MFSRMQLAEGQVWIDAKWVWNSYSNTSQLDLWGGGNLGGSERNKLGLELLEFLLESLLWLLSESVGLDLLGWSLGHL